jgi:hypothetical protein
VSASIGLFRAVRLQTVSSGPDWISLPDPAAELACFGARGGRL